jgi:hypothetical protein
MTRDSKSVNLTHFRRLSICNLFSRKTSHSHDNLRRVSKSPLLHLFTCRRSGTLDWCVTKATSADSSRLANSHYFSSLFYCTPLLLHSSTLLYLSIFQSFIAIGQMCHGKISKCQPRQGARGWHLMQPVPLKILLYWMIATLSTLLATTPCWQQWSLAKTLLRSKCVMSRASASRLSLVSAVALILVDTLSHHKWFYAQKTSLS